MNFLKKMSLGPRGLRHKLTIIFSLISVIPLLICGYLVSYYFLIMGRDIKQITLIIVIGLVIILAGWRLAQQIIDSLIKIAEQAEAVSKGDIKEIKIDREDELGELGASLNKMVGQIKGNIQELKAHLEKIEELTIVDELTNLYNQKYIKGRLSEEIERAITFQHPCSLIFLKIDKIEPYSKETLLPEIALLLKRNADNIDKVGRFEGEKFVLILPEKSKKRAIEIAGKIKQDLSEIKEGLTISIGVSSNPLDSNSAEGLLNKAEIAMQEAEQEGGNCVKAA